MADTDTDGYADNLGVDSGLGVDIEEQVGDTSDPYEGMEQDIAEMLRAKDAAIAEAQNDARHRQSVADRQYNEQAKELAELRGMITGMQNSRDDSEPFDQIGFDNELAKRIAEDTDGTSTLEIVREMIREARSDVLNSVKSEIGGISGSMIELNPEYRENKEQVDTFATKYNVDKKTALSMVKDLMPRKTGQPGTVKAPGRVADNTSASSVRPQKRRVSELGVSPIGDAVAQSVLSGLDITEEEAKMILYRDAED